MRAVLPIVAGLAISVVPIAGYAETPAAQGNTGKVKRGGACSTHFSKTQEALQQTPPGQWTDARTLFLCDHLGLVTVAQVYEKGFRVVGVSRGQPVTAHISTAPAILIIEEQ
jgi:hypothetical protein